MHPFQLLRSRQRAFGPSLSGLFAARVECLSWHQVYLSKLVIFLYLKLLEGIDNVRLPDVGRCDWFLRFYTTDGSGTCVAQENRANGFQSFLHILQWANMSKHVRYRPYMAIKIQNLHQMTLLVAGCLPGTWLCHTCRFRFDCSWEPQRQSVTVLSISVAQYVSNAQLRGWWSYTSIQLY